MIEDMVDNTKTIDTLLSDNTSTQRSTMFSADGKAVYYVKVQTFSRNSANKASVAHFCGRVRTPLLRKLATGP